MTSELRAADPAAHLDPDPRSPDAQRMLRDVFAAPRRRVPARPMRWIASGAVAATAAVVGVIALSSHGDDLGTAAYRVTSDDGTVHVEVRWSELNDPVALQRALDRAHARTRVYVEPADIRLCGPDSTVDYQRGAVEWNASRGSIVLRPDRFPQGATFVMVAQSARPGDPRGSTFGPDAPNVPFAFYMVTGSDTDPAC